MHKQQEWPQAWEYCQAKPIQTLGRASEEVDSEPALANMLP